MVCQEIIFVTKSFVDSLEPKLREHSKGEILQDAGCTGQCRSRSPGLRSDTMT